MPRVCGAIHEVGIGVEYLGIGNAVFPFSGKRAKTRMDHIGIMPFILSWLEGELFHVAFKRRSAKLRAVVHKAAQTRFLSVQTVLMRQRDGLTRRKQAVFEP